MNWTGCVMCMFVADGSDGFGSLLVWCFGTAGNFILFFFCSFGFLFFLSVVVNSNDLLLVCVCAPFCFWWFQSASNGIYIYKVISFVIQIMANARILPNKSSSDRRWQGRCEKKLETRKYFRHRWEKKSERKKKQKLKNVYAQSLLAYWNHNFWSKCLSAYTHTIQISFSATHNTCNRFYRARIQPKLFGISGGG